MRDPVKDWRRWTMAERITAGVILLLPLTILPTRFPLGLPIVLAH